MLLTQPIRKVQDDLDRRWMSDDFFDLIIWYEPSGVICGFQLCYNKKEGECALTWKRSCGFEHSALDSGEQSPNANDTPVLAGATFRDFPLGAVLSEFLRRTPQLEPSIREFVIDRLVEYGGEAAVPSLIATPGPETSASL